MQSTESDTETRSELDGLTDRLLDSAKHPWMIAQPSDLYEIVTALTAERDRADRAEAVIEEIRNAITTTDEGWMIADDDKLAEILEAAQ